jgi:uncharacterized phage protein (TIGR02216 family)
MSFSASAARLAGMTGALLGWMPDNFWTATPAELAAILDALSPPGDAPPDAPTLSRLMEQFPDG